MLLKLAWVSGQTYKTENKIDRGTFCMIRTVSGKGEPRVFEIN